MMHIYAVVLAVVLLIGALAAIIVCVCVDIVPIIKSRGSTLMSRDSVTQEQARMLKKSLQRTKLTSSASADFIESVQGRKTRTQALRSGERPRYGSTPLALLTGEDEKENDVEFKTTTVIMEALPKKPLSENNSKPSDVLNVETEDKTALQDNKDEITETRYEKRKRIEGKAMGGRSGSSPNVAYKRSNSADLLDQVPDVTKGAMTLNTRDPRFHEPEVVSRSYPNSPNVKNSRSQTMNQKAITKLTEDRSERSASNQTTTHAKVHPNYGNPPCNSGKIPHNESGFPGNSTPNSASPTNCEHSHCKWCQLERERDLYERTHERQLPFKRSESFPNSYAGNSSPRTKQKQMHRQHSFEDSETGKYSRGIPYDRNKYCKNPHRGYSPCPDCFHSNQTAYYPYNYHADVTSPSDLQSTGLIMKSSLPLNPSQIVSSASSSSSSGSSSRFRHLRQPLEDIQEDASDCYAIRDVGATSTIDSQELDSGPDDGTMPKSTDNSVASNSPVIESENQSPMASSSGP